MLRRFSFVVAIAYCAAPLPAMAQPSHMARVRAEHACAGMGLNPGEAPFTQCVMSLETSVGATPAPSNGEYVAQEESYHRGDQMTAIHRACAQMGLAPGSAQYQSCFGNLNMTIDDANRVGTD